MSKSKAAPFLMPAHNVDAQRRQLWHVDEVSDGGSNHGSNHGGYHGGYHGGVDKRGMVRLY